MVDSRRILIFCGRKEELVVLDKCIRLRQQEGPEFGRRKEELVVSNKCIRLTLLVV